MTLLVGHEEAMTWLHVACNPHLYLDPLAPVVPPAHAPSVPVEPKTSEASAPVDDDIADCPRLGINTHVVQAQKQSTEDIERIESHCPDCETC